MEYLNLAISIGLIESEQRNAAIIEEKGQRLEKAMKDTCHTQYVLYF